MFEVRLFGTGQACYGTQVMTGFPSQQSHLLLCYLLLNRHRPHDRDQLAAIFWGDCSTSLARKYLRNILWRLRSSLIEIGVPIEKHLFIDDHTVAVLGAEALWLDVDVFEQIVSDLQNLTGQQLNHPQAERLEQAIRLYVGDLLEGIDADWCLYERQRLGLMYLSALSRLMGFYGSVGNYEHALEYGERILAVDNTREKVYREMMRLHWLANDQRAALEMYKRCVQVLRSELGVSPMPATQLMYQQMLHDEFRPQVRRLIANAHEGPVGADLPASTLPLTIAEYALDRIHHLQAIVSETHDELQGIEDLIHHAVSDHLQV